MRHSTALEQSKTLLKQGVLHFLKQNFLISKIKNSRYIKYICNCKCKENRKWYLLSYTLICIRFLHSHQNTIIMLIQKSIILSLSGKSKCPSLNLFKQKHILSPPVSISLARLGNTLHFTRRVLGKIKLDSL